MLLLMGKYLYILDALKSLKIDIIAVFACGAVVGLLSFSHFLSWLLRRFHDVTIALLSGFLFGSLNKIWPWKVQINTANNEMWQWDIEKFNDHSLTLIEKNYLPHSFEKLTGVDAQLFPAIISATVAIVIYIAIDTIARSKKREH